MLFLKMLKAKHFSEARNVFLDNETMLVLEAGSEVICGGCCEMLRRINFIGCRGQKLWCTVYWWLLHDWCSCSKNSISCSQVRSATLSILIVVVQYSRWFLLWFLFIDLIWKMRKISLIMRTYNPSLIFWKRLAAVCKSRTTKNGTLLSKLFYRLSLRL